MDTYIVLKDGRRRVRRSAETRQQFVNEFQQSGLSATQFCSEQNINLQTFYGWMAKQQRRVEKPPVLKEVQVTLPRAAEEVRICFPNRVEVRLQVDSPTALAAVLREAAQC
jgi:transposase-like protein